MQEGTGSKVEGFGLAGGKRPGPGFGKEKDIVCRTTSAMDIPRQQLQLQSEVLRERLVDS